MVTALAMTLTPMLSVGFVLATPDGPLMAGWACCLYLAVRAAQTCERRDFVLLGLAIAFALLSKMFAWALIAGIVAWALMPSRRWIWQKGLGLSFVVAFVLYVPFLLWNAEHHWITFAFAFEERHVPEPSLIRPFSYLLANAGAYSPGLWLAALIVLVRPRNALIAWTSIPLTALLIVLNFHERIELHWIFGPYVSLCVAMGVAFVDLSHRARVLWATAGAVPAAVLIPFLFLAAAFPGPLYEEFRATGSTLRNTGPFEIFTYWPLAQDVRRMADANDAVVITDGYGFSSQMDYEAGIPPVVIGYNAQGQESRHWYDAAMQPKRLLFVDKEPLVPRSGHPDDKDGRPDFQRQLKLACTDVRPGPDLEYSKDDRRAARARDGADAPARLSLRRNRVLAQRFGLPLRRHRTRPVYAAGPNLRGQVLARRFSLRREMGDLPSLCDPLRVRRPGGRDPALGAEPRGRAHRVRASGAGADAREPPLRIPGSRR
jgi:hypothetical protein